MGKIDRQDWHENNSSCAGCERVFPSSELAPDESARAASPSNITELNNFYCPKCLAGRGTTALMIAAKVIDRIGAGLRAAVEREAMWRSALRDNYDGDFGAWLAYSDMHGLAGRLGFANAEEAWKANPTIQGSTDPQDFRVVPEGEQMDLQLSAALGWDPCEECGSNEEPCDCRRRPEAKQPDLTRATRAIRAARDNLDMGDLVIKESPPSMGGMDIYRKGPDYAEDRGNLDKITFLNGMGMDTLGEWITNAGMAARRIAAANSYFVGEMFLPGLRTDPRHEGRMGRIVIGGDRGDVWAASAHADEKGGAGGVTLVDVEFRTTLDLSGLGSDELREEAEEIILGSYDSIQEDTFAPTRTAILVPDDTGTLVHRPPIRLADGTRETNPDNIVGNWPGGWLNGEWKCPECSTIIGRNLKGESPHALVRQHRCSPAGRPSER